RSGPSVPGAGAGVALPEGGILPRAGLIRIRIRRALVAGEVAQLPALQPRGKAIADMSADVGAQATAFTRQRLHASDVPATRAVMAVQVHRAVQELHRDRLGHDGVRDDAGVPV